MTSDSERLRLALHYMSKDRRNLLDLVVGSRRPTFDDVKSITTFLMSLRDLIAGARRTELRGLGVFEWKPCYGKRLPGGRVVDSWRLTFRLCRGHRYKGEGKHGSR